MFIPCVLKKNVFGLTNHQMRGDFKTQPPVDRQLHPVPSGCHCLEHVNQAEPDGTAGQPVVGFWKSSLAELSLMNHDFLFYCKLHQQRSVHPTPQ